MSHAKCASNPVYAPQKGGRKSCALLIRNIRTQEGLARFSGDEGRYRHWLGDFLNHGPCTVGKIRDAINSGEQEAASRLIHSFKGRTGMLGMVELHALAVALEMTLRNNEPSTFWLDDLERTVAATCADLTHALAPSMP